jgi:hypothetical protein
VYVLVDLTGAGASVALREPEAFDAFKVVVDGDGARLAEALSGVGRLAPSGEALLKIDAVAGLAGARAADPRWRAGFDAMLAYAQRRGWIEDGSIRAHVERR